MCNNIKYYQCNVLSYKDKLRFNSVKLKLQQKDKRIRKIVGKKDKKWSNMIKLMCCSNEKKG